jgi:hypothetical protein
MQIVAQQVGPDIAIHQGGIGPIVTLPMGPESAPAPIADTPDGGMPVSTDGVLILRSGALVSVVQSAFVSGLAAAAAAAATAAVASDLAGIDTSIATIDTGLATVTSGLASAEAQIATLGVTTIVNLLAHGADPTGVSDSTAAFVAAFAALPSGGGQISMPPGDYILATPLVLTGKFVALVGAGINITRLHFHHTGFGLDIAPGALTGKVTLRDFSAYAENTGGQTAAVARITFPAASAWGYVTTVIESVEVFGYPDMAEGTAPFPQTFRRGFILNGCWSTRASFVSWSGPPSVAGATSSAVFEINGSNDTRIVNLQAYYGNAAVVQTGYCEGLYFINPLIVGVDWLFKQSAQTGWTGYVANKVSLLGLWCTAGEINVAQGVVQASFLTLGLMVGCDISRDTGAATPAVLFDFTDVSVFKWTTCNIVGGPGGADIAIRLQASFNSSGCSARDLICQNMATALQIVGSNGTVAGQFLDFQLTGVPAATAFLDGSAGSNGNRITMRTPASGSTLAVSGLGSVQPHLFTAADGSPIFALIGTAGAVNYGVFFGATTGNPPILQFRGADTHVNGTIQTKGGSLYLSAAGDQVSGNLAQFLNVIGSCNSFTFQNATTTNVPQIEFTGSDGVVHGAVQTQGGTLFISGNAGGASRGSYAAFQAPQDGTNAMAAIVFTPGSVGGALAMIQTLVGGLVLGPATQLWLGAQSGAGAVYSATILNTAANPGSGAPGKLWNNGGMVALAGAQQPNPMMAAAFAAALTWQDAPANSTLWSHAPVPTPPATLAGLTLADKLRLWPINVGDYVKTLANFDAWLPIQNLLLYAQLLYLAQKSNVLDNIAERDFLDVYLPAGDYLVSQPLIVPDGVRFGGPGRILRAAYTGDQSNNGTTSVPGPFASSLYLPTVIVVPRGHLSDLNIYMNTDGNYLHRGSGVCLGKNWQAQVGAACTIGAAGSGYSVGDIIEMANPSASPYAFWAAQVTAIGAGGSVTSATVLQGGAYALPPVNYTGGTSLQQQQWTASNGFSVFDPANAGCVLATKAYASNFTTPSPGTGATIKPVWAADYVTNGGGLATGALVLCGIQAGRIQVTGGVPANYDPEYGPTFLVMFCGLEFEVDSIQGIGGQTGMFGHFAQDIRIGRMNFVESNLGFMLQGCGSIACANVILDTCGCIGLIDQSHGIRLHGRAFWEEGNLTISGPLINTQGAALKIGASSSPSFPVSTCDIRFTVKNMGGLPASTIAAHSTAPLGLLSPSQQAAICFLQYIDSSIIDLTVSNLSQYGGVVSPLPTSGIYQFGQGVDAGNELRGSIDTVPTIDGVAPPAQVVTSTGGHAYPACAVRVWDGLHSAWIGVLGLAEIIGTGAPTNGTSGTGAGFAAPGSSYVNTASSAGRRYVNGNTLSSPTWS